MFDILIVIFSLAGIVAIGLLGGRFVAAEDARARVREEPDGSTGWLPGPRDAALLAQSARDIRASR